jgi:hypothetical protein
MGQMVEGYEFRSWQVHDYSPMVIQLGFAPPPPPRPPIQWGLGVLSSGVKWLGCEADHSPPTSDKVKNVDLCIHPLPLMSSVLIC